LRTTGLRVLPSRARRELRELSNGIASAYRRRDELIQALALSNSLSREDMARATGLAKSRVDQIIRELTEEGSAPA
jgi:galactose-1-phosphate uridylyltransferase